LKADPLGEWYLVVVVVFGISFYEQGQSQHFDSKDSTWLSCSWIRSFMTSCSFRAETYPSWQTIGHQVLLSLWGISTSPSNTNWIVYDYSPFAR
jgi:hypothetical protein